jgi:hypothetical protein
MALFTGAAAELRRVAIQITAGCNRTVIKLRRIVIICNKVVMFYGFLRLRRVHPTKEVLKIFPKVWTQGKHLLRRYGAVIDCNMIAGDYS